MTLTHTVADPWPAPVATHPVHATVTLPGSKSATNRALVLAALATGPSVLRRPLVSRDSNLMVEALRGLGATLTTRGDDLAITPGPLTAVDEIDCGLAGTVLRFVPPVAALTHGSTTFDGDPHLRTRPVGAMLEALRSLGVGVTGDSPPFVVHGTGSVLGGQVVIDASSSSQFASGLLLAGARFDQGIDIRHDGKPMPSLPHVEMTVSMLRQHGVDVDDSEGNRWVVEPGSINPVDHEIEPDLSNAAPFLALAAVSGGKVTVRDWPRATTQAGDLLREILAEMGCSVTLTDEGLTVEGTGTLSGLDLDLHDAGELAPAVTALCALADSPSHLRGIAHIRGHETDRLAALRTELAGLGADIREHDDGLSLRPAPLHGGVFRTYADHRMAHAGVILGARVEGIEVENVATTAKTFTDFAPFWSRLVDPDR